MAVNLSIFAGVGAQFFNSNGVPLAGGLIYSYVAGTTTPAVTYTSNTGLTAHANPIVLDAAGRVATGEIWLTSGVDYKFILKDASFVQIGSYDNVSSIVPSTFITNLADTTNPVLGDALIGFRQSDSLGNLIGAVGRTVHQKLQESVSVKDFGAVGDNVASDATAFTNAADAATLSGTIFVPKGIYKNGKPKGVAKSNILWNYYEGGNSISVVDLEGNRGGNYAVYESQATQVLIAQIAEDQSSISSVGFRDALFVNAVDTDLVDYTTIAQKVTYAMRGFAQGSYNGSTYNAQYKDIVGAFFSAEGNIQWSPRGVSGVVCDARQYGIGVASNEFAVINPPADGGGIAQSKSMAGVQAIVQSRFAPEDATHESRGFVLTVDGERISAGLQMVSLTANGYTSQIKYGIDMRYADITGAGIIMPVSAYGTNAGTIIEYETNTYTLFDRANKFYEWVINTDVIFGATANGLSIGGTLLTNTRLFINAGTTALSQMRLFAGVAPTSPTNGDIWFDGTNLSIRVSGTTRTFNLT